MHEFVNNFGNNSKDKDPTNTNEQNLADAQQEKIVGKTQYGTNLDRPEDNLV
jgi:hypothetical protein